MNPLNYTSLDISKGLLEAGIVLETEAVWFGSLSGWILAPKENNYSSFIPAPNLSELWRELPAHIDDSYLELCKYKTENKTCASYVEIREEGGWAEEVDGSFFKNTNPCDALAELLILVRSQP
jgi:hypothetical protein